MWKHYAMVINGDGRLIFIFMLFKSILFFEYFIKFYHIMSINIIFDEVGTYFFVSALLLFILTPLFLPSSYALLTPLFLPSANAFFCWWRVASLVERCFAGCIAGGALRRWWSVASLVERCVAGGALRRWWSVASLVERCVAGGALRRCWSVASLLSLLT